MGAGLLNQMGGIGAHSDLDYESLKAFVEQPWECPYEVRESDGPILRSVASRASQSSVASMSRSVTCEESEKNPRRRSKLAQRCCYGQCCAAGMISICHGREVQPRIAP